MSVENRKVPVELPVGVVGNWKEGYEWIPIFGAFAAVAVAFSAGANNVPAPFSTLVGSGTTTLLMASMMACVIYVPGAGFASKATVDSLFSHVVQEHQPSEGFLMWSIAIVLLTVAIWLTIATYLELPVSPQQSTESALLGTVLVTEGFEYIPLWNKKGNHHFNGEGLVWILLGWTVAPLLACLFAWLFFTLLKAFLLQHERSEKRVLIFLAINFGISAGLLCIFVMFQIVQNIVPVKTWITIGAVAVATLSGGMLSLVVLVPIMINRLNAVTVKSNEQNNSISHEKQGNQDNPNVVKEGDKHEDDKTEDDAEEILRRFMQTRVLSTVYEEEERSWVSPDSIQDSEHAQSVSVSTVTSTNQSTPFKLLLESKLSPKIQRRNSHIAKDTPSPKHANVKDLAQSTLWPDIEYGRNTIIRHALAEKYDDMEKFFSFPHILASCIFALIQSAIEIAALVGPLEVIVDVYQHRAKYSKNRQELNSIHTHRLFRVISGFAAALGFFLCGWRLTRCLGGKVAYISNSRGLALQLSSVAAVIIVTSINLPVSTVYASVGGLLGVGMADDLRNVNWKLLLKFVCGWVMTVVFCCGIGYVTFSASIHSPSYVVP